MKNDIIDFETHCAIIKRDSHVKALLTLWFFVTIKRATSIHIDRFHCHAIIKKYHTVDGVKKL